MPKIIDPELRRQAIADALFEVIREGGLSKVTLSSVADRAGLAIGSVRHFLGTYEEMIVFAFETVSERFRSRIFTRSQALLADLEAGKLDADRRLEATAELLCEFLPLDTDRRDEAIVWIEFETAARTDSRLTETSQHSAAEMTQLIKVVLESICARNSGSFSADVSVEAARLSALLDGLTIRSILHPDFLETGQMREVVITHLRQLRGDGSNIEDEPRSA